METRDEDRVSHDHPVGIEAALSVIAGHLAGIETALAAIAATSVEALDFVKRKMQASQATMKGMGQGQRSGIPKREEGVEH
jgi:hypothetical protein